MVLFTCHYWILSYVWNSWLDYNPGIHHFCPFVCPFVGSPRPLPSRWCLWYSFYFRNDLDDSYSKLPSPATNDQRTVECTLIIAVQSITFRRQRFEQLLTTPDKTKFMGFLVDVDKNVTSLWKGLTIYWDLLYLREKMYQSNIFIQWSITLSFR